jgi:hypothetical protein
VSVTVFSAKARCVSDSVQCEGEVCQWQCSVRGRVVSVTVFSGRARCVSDSVQWEGEVCQ